MKFTKRCANLNIFDVVCGFVNTVWVFSTQNTKHKMLFQHLSLCLVMLPMSRCTTDDDKPASVVDGCEWASTQNENFIRNMNVQKHTIRIDKNTYLHQTFLWKQGKSVGKQQCYTIVWYIYFTFSENRRRTKLLYNAGHSSSGRINMLFHVNQSHRIGWAEPYYY